MSNNSGAIAAAAAVDATDSWAYQYNEWCTEAHIYDAR